MKKKSYKTRKMSEAVGARVNTLCDHSEPTKKSCIQNEITYFFRKCIREKARRDGPSAVFKRLFEDEASYLSTLSLNDVVEGVRTNCGTDSEQLDACVASPPIGIMQHCRNMIQMKEKMKIKNVVNLGNWDNSDGDWDNYDDYREVGPGKFEVEVEVDLTLEKCVEGMCESKRMDCVDDGGIVPLIVSCENEFEDAKSGEDYTRKYYTPPAKTDFGPLACVDFESNTRERQEAKAACAIRHYFTPQSVSESDESSGGGTENFCAGISNEDGAYDACIASEFAQVSLYADSEEARLASGMSDGARAMLEDELTRRESKKKMIQNIIILVVLIVFGIIVVKGG
tara:strand:+ start:280 stop:1302 length:1023 start_codon:yes stop_codon:yes gene_type:complete